MPWNIGEDYVHAAAMALALKVLLPFFVTMQHLATMFNDVTIQANMQLESSTFLQGVDFFTKDVYPIILQYFYCFFGLI